MNFAARDSINPRDLSEVDWCDGINHPSDR